MKKIGVIEVPEHVIFFPGEQEAVAKAIEIGDQFGYGNIMSHIATAWAANLVKQGLSRKAAIAAVSNRSPYPLPKKIKATK